MDLDFEPYLCTQGGPINTRDLEVLFLLHCPDRKHQCLVYLSEKWETIWRSRCLICSIASPRHRKSMRPLLLYQAGHRPVPETVPARSPSNDMLNCCRVALASPRDLIWVHVRRRPWTQEDGAWRESCAPATPSVPGRLAAARTLCHCHAVWTLATWNM